MTVKALQRFDRESEAPGKKVAIPIKITDRGGMSAVRNVYVYIGDRVRHSSSCFM